MLFWGLLAIRACESFVPRGAPLSCCGISVARNMSGLEPSSLHVVTRKKECRKKIRDAIKALTFEDIQSQSQCVWDRLVDLPAYKTAKSIGLFLSMPMGEINTDPILNHAVKHGKDIYVPEVGMNFESAQMELIKVILETQDPTFHKSWPTNRWSIPEPPPDMPRVAAKPGDLDLLVVPGLGFDENCNRLGQGKGYYDRFIARMTAGDTVLPLVGVALAAQWTGLDIPVNSYDKQMDMVIFPSRIIVSERTQH